jgi:hypothetical protein
MTRTMLGAISIAAWLAAAAGLAAQELAPPQPEQVPSPVQEEGPINSDGRNHVYHKKAPVDPNVPAGKIVFESTVHDFGHIVDTEPAVCEFKFRNDGPGDLIIYSVNSTCGCTVAELDKTIYKPGESGSLGVTFDPSGKHGAITKRLNIQSNDPDQPTIVLQINTQVEQLVGFDPAFLTFGNLRKGEIQSRVIAVTGRTPDFNVTEVALVGNPALSAVILGAEDVVLSDGTTGRRVEIEVTADGTAKPGTLQAQLQATTNDSRREKVNASLTGFILGDVSSDAERLPIGLLPPGKTFERTVRLESRQGKPFAFLGAELKAPIGEHGVNWEVLPPAEGAQPGPQSVYDIKIVVTAGPKTGALRGVLVLKTDVPDEEQIELPFWGTVRAPK